MAHRERSQRSYSKRLKCLAKSHREPVRLSLPRSPKHSCSGNPILSGASQANVIISVKQAT